MHCNLLGVLDEGVAPSHLHGDSVHPLHCEHVRDAALQGDEGLQETNAKDNIKIRVRLTQDHSLPKHPPVSSVSQAEVSLIAANVS